MTDLNRHRIQKALPNRALINEDEHYLGDCDAK